MRKFIAWLPCMLCWLLGLFVARIATYSSLACSRLLDWSEQIDEWAELGFWNNGIVDSDDEGGA